MLFLLSFVKNTLLGWIIYVGHWVLAFKMVIINLFLISKDFCFLDYVKLYTPAVFFLLTAQKLLYTSSHYLFILFLYVYQENIFLVNQQKDFIFCILQFNFT